jgi:uncharacterized protein (TIGR02099 family)
LTSKPTLFSYITKTILFIFAHIPLRIIANIIFYIAIISIFLHYISYYIEKHPDRIEQFIEDSLFINIDFTSIKVNYNLLNPRLKLTQLRIFKSKKDKINFLKNASNKPKSEENGLHFKSVSISFNLFKSILFFQPYIKYINLDGFNASLTHNFDKSFSIGTPKAKNIFNFKLPDNSNGESSEVPLWLLRLNSFSITNTKLIINDQINNIIDYQLNELHIKFTNHNNWEHSISLSAKNNQVQSPTSPMVFDQINFIADFRGSIYKLKQWTGKFYLNIADLKYQNNKRLDQLIKNHSTINLIKTNATIKLWGYFSQSTISQLIGDMQLNQTELKNYSNKQKLKIDSLSSFFKLDENKHFLKSSRNSGQQLKNWLISLYHLEVNKNLIKLPYLHVNILKKASKFNIKSYIEKINLSGWEDILNFTNKKWYQAYLKMQAQGTLNNVSSHIIVENSHIVDYQVNIKANKLSANAWKQLPKFSNLSAQLWADKSNGLIDINSSNLGLELKPEFKHPWQLEKLLAQISWQTIASQKWINIDVNTIRNSHLKINGNAQLWSNLPQISDKQALEVNKSPLLLISANFSDVDASHVPTYLPTTVFGKGLYDWLNKAFISAQVPDGGVIFSGRLNKFPYSKSNGIMEITFHTKDLLLNYHHGWPLFKKISSEIQFTETGMLVTVDNVQLYNSSSRSTQVKLDNYLTDDIKIKSIINASASDAFKYLGKTKLLNPNIIEQLESNGKININLALTIPEDDRKPISSIIETQLIDVVFSPKWLAPHRIENINGRFELNNNILSSSKIVGRLNNEILIAAIKNKKESTNGSVTENVTLVNIDGTISIGTIKNSSFIPKFLSGLFTQVEGKTKFNTLLTISDIDGRIYPHIEIKSDLVGIESKLPKPFNKEKHIKKTLNLTIKDNNYLSFLDLNYSDQLTYCSESLLSKNKELKVSINFSEQKCNLPKVPSILLSGKLDLSNYKQWQELLVKDETKKDEQNIDKNIDEGTRLKEINFNFQAIKLPKYFLSPKSIGEKEQNKDQQKGQQKGQQIEPTKVSSIKLENTLYKTNSFLANTAINGTIKNLIIGDNRVGSLTIKSHPEVDIIKFDEIKFIGEHTLINIKGSTFQEKNIIADSTNINVIPTDKDNRLTTEMQGKVFIKDLGSLLKKLNISDDIQNTDTKFWGDLKWNGLLSSFSKDKLKGKISFESKKGYIKSIKPGIGRIISIFNLADIQRRLDLNFSDVSENGFDFDSIKGNLIFNQQILSTKDVAIDSNIAKIYVNGYINLDIKSCNHTFTIVPDISTGLPYAGLALAGPIGAAVGFLGQKVIGSEINKISKYNFKVKGPCSDPEVKEQVTNKKDSAKDIFDIEQSN